MSHYRAQRRGARSELTKSGLARLEAAVLSLAPYAWFRADTYTSSGSAVTTLPNRAGVGKLNITGTLALPTAKASLGGALALSLTGTQWGVSDQAASSWAYQHNGTGAQSIIVGTPTSVAGVRVLWSTMTAGNPTGAQLYTNSTSFFAQANNGSGLLFGGGALSAVASGTATDISLSYIEGTSPEYAVVQDGVSKASGSTALAPSAADPGATLYLGSQNATFGASFDLGEWISFKRVLSTAEFALYRRYLKARYGRP